MTQRKPLWILIGVVAALTIFRLCLAGIVELLPEEAYYWTYSKHPALGYFDHPPMVAWIIWLSTRLLGDTEVGVRLVNVLLSVASCILLVATGRVWFGERVAVWAALLCSVLPIFVGIGFIVTPDGALVFFWLLTLLAVTHAVQTRRTMFWLLAGIGMGGGLLSKYYALLLAPSLVLFLLFSREHRFWLRRPQPWLAGAVALVVFSPVIIWNAQHGWASFAFQSTRTIGQSGSAWVKVGQFWLVQLGMLTPPVFALFVAATVAGIKRGWREGDDKWNFAVSFALPLFLLFGLATVKASIHVNWTAPAFLSLALAGAAVFLEGTDNSDRGQARLWRVGGWAAGILCAVVIGVGHLSLATGQPAIFAYNRAGGWRELATQAEGTGRELAARTGQQPFFIGADKYNIAAELGFYLKQPNNCVNLYALGAGGLGYRFWTDLEKFAGRPAVVVSLNLREALVDDLKQHFEKVDKPEPVSVAGHGTAWANARLIRCYGYRRETVPASP